MDHIMTSKPHYTGLEKHMREWMQEAFQTHLRAKSEKSILPAIQA